MICLDAFSSLFIYFIPPLTPFPPSPAIFLSLSPHCPLVTGVKPGSPSQNDTHARGGHSSPKKGSGGSGGVPGTRKEENLYVPSFSCYADLTQPYLTLSSLHTPSPPSVFNSNEYFPSYPYPLPLPLPPINSWSRNFQRVIFLSNFIGKYCTNRHSSSPRC